ncbi:MAG: GTP cyclohydrolase II [Promethearchaeati archaeon SRVP18_Atabeyarchaeia-1]
MIDQSYRQILEKDTQDYKSCPLKWDCENCDKSLCLRIVALADFPTKHGHFNIIGFLNNKDKKDHLMVVKGNVAHEEDVLTRLHSSCVTGDALGSLRCDCGPQLAKSLDKMEREGRGILLYMQQEGRGIGLTNKIVTYMLQDLGADTYEANVDLGFKPDERDYELAAAMLRSLDVKSIRLLTNNPEKIVELRRYGIKISERIPLQIRPNKYNRSYLETKKARFGHLLSLESASRQSKRPTKHS